MGIIFALLTLALIVFIILVKTRGFKDKVTQVFFYLHLVLGVILFIASLVHLIDKIDESTTLTIVLGSILLGVLALDLISGALLFFIKNKKIFYSHNALTILFYFLTTVHVLVAIFVK